MVELRMKIENVERCPEQKLSVSHLSVTSGFQYKLGATTANEAEYQNTTDKNEGERPAKKLASHGAPLIRSDRETAATIVDDEC